MNHRIPMTIEGAQRLRDELERLKFKERPKVIEAISEARKHGDLRENADYHAAKEWQGFLEGRINEVESKLAHAQIIDVTKIANNGKVIFGSTVFLENVESGEEVTYRIVGDDEADLKDGKISVNSPIARAVIGKAEGDLVVVQTPNGEVEYEINSVKYI